MKKSWFAYIVARVLVFAIPLAVLLILGFDPYFSCGVAAIIGLALSMLLLNRWRSALSAEIYDRVQTKRDAQAIAEDDIVDKLSGKA